MFQNDLITPAAFFIHSRRLKEDHLLFMRNLRQLLPLLALKKLLMVTDREFDFSHCAYRHFAGTIYCTSI